MGALLILSLVHAAWVKSAHNFLHMWSTHALGALPRLTLHVLLLLLAGGRRLRVTAPLSAKDTLDLQDAHREALALIEAASMGVGGFMGALSATALASTAPGSAGAAGQRSSVAMAAAGMVARQERALKWSQGVLARALEMREATFRCDQHCACPVATDTAPNRLQRLLPELQTRAAAAVDELSAACRV